MSTIAFQTACIDQDFRLREPQPIAAVIPKVLARYGLSEAPQHNERGVGDRAAARSARSDRKLAVA